jgi:hypothetical protein
MKKNYRVWDEVNNFETVVTVTEEEIIEFTRFIEDLFDYDSIKFEEVETENSLYNEYANYLIEDGLLSPSDKEIKINLNVRRKH